MEEGEKKELCRQLGVTDSSLGFLLFIVAGVLLSFWSVTIQRRQLCLTIAGETEAAAATHDVFPMRRTSSALILGALVFFLLVALRARQEACRGGGRGGRQVGRRQPVGLDFGAGGGGFAL